MIGYFLDLDESYSLSSLLHRLRVLLFSLLSLLYPHLGINKCHSVHIKTSSVYFKTSSCLQSGGMWQKGHCQHPFISYTLSSICCGPGQGSMGPGLPWLVELGHGWVSVGVADPKAYFFSPTALSWFLKCVHHWGSLLCCSLEARPSLVCTRIPASVLQILALLLPSTSRPSRLSEWSL
jgi:hypothetical protein